MATLGRIQHHYPALEGLDATAAKVYAPGGICGMRSNKHLRRHNLQSWRCTWRSSWPTQPRAGHLTHNPTDPPQAADLIRHRALALGFDAIGFCRAELGPETRTRLADFLAAGLHGDMGWLARRAEQRSHPQSLWPAARSVIALGLSYAPQDDPLARWAGPTAAAFRSTHAIATITTWRKAG